MVARSITFRNSRTLPGQPCCSSWKEASELNDNRCELKRWRKLVAKAGKSSMRSLAARGRSTEKSRVVIRCCKATTVPSVGQQRRVQPDRRNCLPQAQQKAQKLGKYL